MMTPSDEIYTAVHEVVMAIRVRWKMASQRMKAEWNWEDELRNLQTAAASAAVDAYRQQTEPRRRGLVGKTSR